MSVSKGQFENQVVIKSLRVEHAVVGKDGVVQVDAVLGSIYRIQNVSPRVRVMLVASARAKLVQSIALNTLAQHVLALIHGEKEVFESLVDSIRRRVLDNGGGKLNNQLIHQGPRHVLHEIVVGVSARDFVVDIEHEGERARDDDLVIRQLGHADVQGLPRVGACRVEGDALHRPLGLHGTENFLRVRGQQAWRNSHGIYCVLCFINTIYTSTAMDGDYDPDRENKNTPLDHTLDNDDDDDDTTPGTPAAASTPYRPGATPYHPGEEHEMTNLPREQSGVVHGPGEPAWNALAFLFPDAKASEVEAYYDPKSQRLIVKKAGAGQAPYYLFTREIATGQERLNPKIPPVLRRSLGETALNQVRALQQERARNSQEIRKKTQTKQQLEVAAQELPTLRQEMGAIRDQSRQLVDEIRELEDQTGPWDEEAIQRLKDEKKKLEAEHQRKREQYDRAYAAAQQALQLQVDINDLKLANKEIDRQSNKLGIKAAKPLDELEQEKADLEKRLAEKKRVLADENASPSDIEAANKQVEKDERALERVNEDIEREEQKLPLRERVKNIFKKYGWTLQAVVLIVGVVLTTLALTATNGIKAGTKALGQGLKAIGKKLGSLLPGLIGSIASFIFKTAGQVFSFLGEHAWLPILAVVAFFIERLLKRKSK